MATYFVAAVRVEGVAAPYVHEHITHVKLTDGTVLTREQVIAAIRAGHVFYTNANPPALVIVHKCPHCGAGSYITTHPDSTKENNLLSLPRF